MIVRQGCVREFAIRLITLVNDELGTRVRFVHENASQALGACTVGVEPALFRSLFDGPRVGKSAFFFRLRARAAQPELTHAPAHARRIWQGAIVEVMPRHDG